MTPRWHDDRAASGGEPADGIGAFAGPAFDADDIAAHLAAWRRSGIADAIRQLNCCAAQKSGISCLNGAQLGSAEPCADSLIWQFS